MLRNIKNHQLAVRFRVTSHGDLVFLIFNHVTSRLINLSVAGAILPHISLYTWEDLIINKWWSYSGKPPQTNQSLDTYHATQAEATKDSTRQLRDRTGATRMTGQQVKNNGWLNLHTSNNSHFLQPLTDTQPCLVDSLQALSTTLPRSPMHQKIKYKHIALAHPLIDQALWLCAQIQIFVRYSSRAW